MSREDEIAVKVMGWPHWYTNYESPYEGIESAWMVVERMREMWWCFDLTNHPKSDSMHRGVHEATFYMHDGRIGFATSVAAPEAICRAALAAINAAEASTARAGGEERA